LFDLDLHYAGFGEDFICIKLAGRKRYIYGIIMAYLIVSKAAE
jgi:hypothetical protein